MAVITKGILGGFSGKVGTIVGANYRGKDIIRSVPKPSSRLPTAKQLLQQDKFKLVVAFLQPLKSIQSKYFGQNSGARSKVNLSTSYTLNNALQVVANVPSILFNKVLITKGELAGFQNISTEAKADRVVQVTWEDNSMQGNANTTDLVNVVCYCDSLSTFEIFADVATRGDGTVSVSLPPFYDGLQVHVYIYMNTVEEKQACNSPYLGLITLI